MKRFAKFVTFVAALALIVGSFAGVRKVSADNDNGDRKVHIHLAEGESVTGTVTVNYYDNTASASATVEGKTDVITVVVPKALLFDDLTSIEINGYIYKPAKHGESQGNGGGTLNVECGACIGVPMITLIPATPIEPEEPESVPATPLTPATPIVFTVIYNEADGTDIAAVTMTAISVAKDGYTVATDITPDDIDGKVFTGNWKLNDEVKTSLTVDDFTDRVANLDPEYKDAETSPDVPGGEPDVPGGEPDVPGGDPIKPEKTDETSEIPIIIITTPEPTPEVTPEVTPEATPEPTPEVTPEPEEVIATEETETPEGAPVEETPEVAPEEEVEEPEVIEDLGDIETPQGDVDVLPSTGVFNDVVFLAFGAIVAIFGGALAIINRRRIF